LGEFDFFLVAALPCAVSRPAVPALSYPTCRSSPAVPAGCIAAVFWLPLNLRWLCHAEGICFSWEMRGEMREFELLFSHHTGEAVAFDFAQSTAVTIFIVLVKG